MLLNKCVINHTFPRNKNVNYALTFAKNEIPDSENTIKNNHGTILINRITVHLIIFWIHAFLYEGWLEIFYTTTSLIGDQT